MPGSAIKKLRYPLWVVRITRFEYWPFWLFYLPAFIYWFIQALITRRLLYFTAANPAIHLGGFFGESKSAILNLIPQEYCGKFILLQFPLSSEKILNLASDSGIGLPFILKPDQGERGHEVEKITDKDALDNYLTGKTGTYILQEFLNMPVELGILYYRYPDKSSSGISSLTTKKFFAVKGDGRSTMEELIIENPRYHMHLDSVRNKLGSSMSEVLHDGEEILVEPIGNHCRGTMFLDGNHLINERLVGVFDRITSRMDGFFFGRFDLKVSSVEDLYSGKNIRIMELNGTTSEPSHIYDPSYNIFRAYRDIFRNMKIVQRISVQNIRLGVRPTAFSEFLRTVYSHFRNNNG